MSPKALKCQHLEPHQSTCLVTEQPRQKTPQAHWVLKN